LDGHGFPVLAQIEHTALLSNGFGMGDIDSGKDEVTPDASFNDRSAPADEFLGAPLMLNLKLFYVLVLLVSHLFVISCKIDGAYIKLL
jgi:hypothetical protein